ncbi:PREDICTED: glycoprotein hormone beta-5 [Elephantulus edwardii]|uniref:glycoprotein hormone beta-5 n=1 Tax=Elephantulus edwardii TaxID=28737 RepID=UPI0003F0D8BA|nr:PREDICTED: glycoprotein hormone beta-5 [Elephantulus edwardii]
MISCTTSIPDEKLASIMGCTVKDHTFLAKKPGCKGLAITTSSCWGHCLTWEKPILRPPYIKSFQQACTYNVIKYKTVQLPDCAPGVDPNFTYPVAVSCTCSKGCNMDSTECESI